MYRDQPDKLVDIILNVAVDLRKPMSSRLDFLTILDMYRQSFTRDELKCIYGGLNIIEQMILDYQKEHNESQQKDKFGDNY